ncbi:hypothetical protein R1flu_008214 [Riccia fluitans]|uniref:Reverse transcriptase/retrotransposon-derived protein RNase H-like domain-containing protein n=1 Tax=Riccia fluitans TaxID=41844 RepID=A0ABD1YB18_9MARC
MREEYMEEDYDRITQRTFLDWIETQPGCTLSLSKLKREFERKYSQLPLRERLTLDSRCMELFLRAADDVSTDRLCFMLSDRAVEGVQPRVAEPQLQFPPKVVPQVPLMALPVPAVVLAAAPVQQPGAIPTTAPVAAPRGQRQRPTGNQNQQNVIDDLTRQLRKMRVEIAGLRQNVPILVAVALARPIDGPRYCIWCDSVDHMRAECIELAAAVRDGVVNYQNDRLHLIATEKKRRDEAELDASPSDVTGPRVTRRRAGDIFADVPSSSRAPPPPPGPMEDVHRDISAKGRGQKALVQKKNKAPAYKLAADIEAATHLKAVLEKGILHARVEFSLRGILGIAKREFHDLIIDVIKRKGQTVAEQVVSQMARVAEDILLMLIVMLLLVLERVQLGGLAEPVTAFVDTGFEINIISRAVYERGQWPIDLHHGWALRSANGLKKEMYNACPYIPIRIVRDAGSESLVANIPLQQTTDSEVDWKEWHSGVVVCSADSFSSFHRNEDLKDGKKIWLEKLTEKFRCTDILSFDESISGVFEENVILSSVADWCDTVYRCLEKNGGAIFIPLHYRDMYEEVASFLCYLSHLELECLGRHAECWCSFAHEAEVHTKYKSVLKKVKPIATQLPQDSERQVELGTKQPNLRDVRRIGHKSPVETLAKLKIGWDDFLTDCEKKKFEEMILSYEKAFSFSTMEIGCVDPKVIAPMVIFTMPHVPWDLKPIPVLRAMLSKLIDLLKEKMRMGILELSMAPYSSRWFTIPKKNGSLHFIQDLQPTNSVTIRNVGIGPIIDDVVDEFAGRAIYFVGDLYSGYDQFQLAMENRDLMTIRTPLGLMRICTLPQGATNSIAHMQNAMHKVLREFVPEITIPLLDDIPMKGCVTEEKDETLDAIGCRKFVSDHIRDVGKILSRLSEVHLTLSGEKSQFGMPEILVVGHVCDSFGRRPNPVKVEAIAKLVDCRSTIESPLVLRRLDYTCGKPVIIIVDTSPKAIGWAIGQDDVDGVRFAGRYGAKILIRRQRDYPHVKREFWGVNIALQNDKNFSIGIAVVLETDYLPLLSMIANCSTPDITILHWIAYVWNFNPELKHIVGKENVVADMLSRA